MLLRQHLYIETAPWCLFASAYTAILTMKANHCMSDDTGSRGLFYLAMGVA